MHLNIEDDKVKVEVVEVEYTMEPELRLVIYWRVDPLMVMALAFGVYMNPPLLVAVDPVKVLPAPILRLMNLPSR